MTLCMNAEAPPYPAPSGYVWRKYASKTMLEKFINGDKLRWYLEKIK